jgi:hypothetical protein
MSYGSETVDKFRSMVNEGVSRQVKQTQNPSLNRLQTVDSELAVAELELTYKSEYRVFYGPEGPYEKQVWEVTTDKIEVLGHYLGYMAILSFEDNPDSLIREWSIISPIESFYVQSSKLLATDDALSDAIIWMMSPEFEAGRASRLMKPTPQEIETNTLELERLDLQLDKILKAQHLENQLFVPGSTGR